MGAATRPPLGRCSLSTRFIHDRDLGKAALTEARQMGIKAHYRWAEGTWRWYGIYDPERLGLRRAIASEWYTDSSLVVTASRDLSRVRRS